jgi:hypothetical protein
MLIKKVLTAESAITKFEIGAAYSTGSFAMDNINGTNMTPPPTPEEAASAPPSAQSAVSAQACPDNGKVKSVGASVSILLLLLRPLLLLA